jgi:cytochrome bd-type quinol oxidase subunit 2
MKNHFNLIKYLVVGSLLSLTFFIVSTTYAVGLKDGFKTTGNLSKFASSSNYTAPETPEFYVGRILTAFFSLLGVLAIALIIYSGITWMTARGNEAKASKAKETLFEVIIGLLFIIGSYALTTFLLKIFTK